MIRKIILVLFFIFTNIILIAQLRFDYSYTQIEPAQLIATYQLTWAEDSTQPESYRHNDMMLFLGKEKSWFISNGAYRWDTTMKSINNIDEFRALTSDINQPRSRFQYKIYKNYPGEKLTFIDYVPSSYFRYEEDLNLFNWHLLSDTATIKGYKTQKAFCDYGGRRWEAWYAPEIPFSDGPYKFNGLPGLILNIKDTDNDYIFEFKSIEKPAEPIIIEIKDLEYFECTKQEFFKAEDNFRSNIITYAQDAGISKDGQQKVFRKSTQKNNPIELIRK